MKEILPDTWAVPVPDEFSYQGIGYNHVYQGGEKYELHSLPQSELPPIPTELLVSKYEMRGPVEDGTGARYTVFSPRRFMDSEK